MIIANTIDQVRKQVRAWRAEGLTVGLVPTMGYLHEGHASLVDRAVADCDKVVASVFVNPTQFAAGEDLDKYPRDFEGDCRVLEEHGCHMVFHPSVDEMYPGGKGSTDTYVDMLGEMPAGLCGRSRPSHFRGVCTVVSKLFNIVTPDRAYFGRKDAQQLAIIRKMAADLNFGIEIVGCPTVREEDGLAKSSRNAYLSPAEREAAIVVPSSMLLAQRQAARGEKSTARIMECMKRLIEREPLAKVDYIEAVDPLTLEPVDVIESEVLFAVAVFIGRTRLIDNILVGQAQTA